MGTSDTVTILDGLELDVIISSSASNNTCCVLIETTPPGSGPPPHKHLREEEVFTVLDGEYEFYVEDEWKPLSRNLPRLSLRNTFHAFRNVGDSPGRIMLMTNNGGLDEYFRAISGFKIPQDADKLAAISAHYGYEYLTKSS